MNKSAFKVTGLIALCLSIAFLFCGCFHSEDDLKLSQLEPQAYSHTTGYRVQIPADWQPLAQTSSGVYFTDGENKVSLNIISEIGGMDIYSLEEMSQTVQEKFSTHLKNIQEVQPMKVKDATTQYGVVLKGDDEGVPVITNIWIYEPVGSVRYYLIFTCGGDDYQDYDKVFEDIINSFEFAADEDEIFSLLNLSKEEYVEMMREGLEKI